MARDRASPTSGARRTSSAACPRRCSGSEGRHGAAGGAGPRPGGRLRIHRRRLPAARSSARACASTACRASSSLAGVRAAILDLGRAVVGAEEAARRLVARYDATLAELARRLAARAARASSTGPAEMTAGGRHRDRRPHRVRGRRRTWDAEMGVQGIAPPGAERAFVADPDVILVGTWPGRVEALRAHPLLSQLRAVREGRIVVLPERAAGRAHPVHGRRLLGPGLRAASGPRARGAGRDARRRRRRLVLLALLAAAARSRWLAAAALGSVPLPSAIRRWPRSPSAAGLPPARPPLDPPGEAILWSVRLPRVLLAALVGGGLAVVGATLQSVFRNPMADSGLLGVGAGAALGAVLAVRLGWAAHVFLGPAARRVRGRDGRRRSPSTSSPTPAGGPRSTASSSPGSPSPRWPAPAPRCCSWPPRSSA